MPNHISNIIEANKLVIDSLLLSGVVDFNTVIPMPDTLENMEHSGDIENAIEILFGLPFALEGTPFENVSINSRIKPILDKTPIVDFKKEGKLEQLLTAINNQIQHGAWSWYEWAKSNWGTKWNAYDYDPERKKNNSIYFCTAWNPPYKVIEALSRKFPEEQITLKTADEDCGQQCHIITYQNGEKISSTTLQEIDAIKHYFLIKLGINNPSETDLKNHGFEKDFTRIQED